MLGCIAGCGSTTGTVSGTVKYKGTPLATGRIVLQRIEGRSDVYEGPIKDGLYSIRGIPLGSVKVAIESFVPDPESLKNVPKGLGIPPGKSADRVAPGKGITIPKHYADISRSGLEFSVTSGQQNKDFDLTD